MRTECTPLLKCLLICVQRSLLKQGSSPIVSSLTIPFLERIVSYRVLKRIHFSSLPPLPPRTYRLDPFLDMPFTSYFFVLLLENDKTTITRCLFSWREGFRDEVTNSSWVSSPFSISHLHVTYWFYR